MDRGFVGGEQPPPLHLGDDRVIRRERLEAPVPVAVGAAVADVRDGAAPSRIEVEGDHGRPHPFELGILSGEAEDPFVRRCDGVREGLLGSPAGPSAEGLGDGLDRGLAGGGATAMTSHTVGDDQQVGPVVESPGVAAVLVRLPDASDVRLRRDLDRGGQRLFGRAAHRVFFLGHGPKSGSHRAHAPRIRLRNGPGPRESTRIRFLQCTRGAESVTSRGDPTNAEREPPIADRRAFAHTAPNGGRPTPRASRGEGEDRGSGNPAP